jgi:hypothetical protein
MWKATALEMTDAEQKDVKNRLLKHRNISATGCWEWDGFTRGGYGVIA